MYLSIADECERHNQSGIEIYRRILSSRFHRILEYIFFCTHFSFIRQRAVFAGVMFDIGKQKTWIGIEVQTERKREKGSRGIANREECWLLKASKIKMAKKTLANNENEFGEMNDG